MKAIFTLLLSSTLAIVGFSQNKLTKLWENNKQLATPESVLVLSNKSELLVSLIDGAGNEKDGKGGVAILNIDGSMKNPTWITGLNAPKGLSKVGNKLYIADLDEVVIADIKSGKILSKIPVDGSTFLNDVTADASGNVYVSDTRQNKIFVLTKDKPSLFMEDVPSVNGLKFVDDHLFALAGPELWKIDASKNKTIVATGFEQGGDGLEPVGNGDYLVTCWAGLIYYVNADGSINKMMDVQGKMNTADLGYDPTTKTLFIPTFNNNSVIAYKLD